MNELRIPSLILAVKCGDAALVAKLLGAAPIRRAPNNFLETRRSRKPRTRAAKQSSRCRAGERVGPDQPDGQHRTALLWGIKTANVSLVKLLLQHGSQSESRR